MQHLAHFKELPVSSQRTEPRAIAAPPKYTKKTMFAFDISGLALEVAPPDTGRVRLVAVTSGLLEARPHEIGADFPDRVARGVWLRACSGEAMATATPRPI